MQGHDSQVVVTDVDRSEMSGPTVPLYVLFFGKGYYVVFVCVCVPYSEDIVSGVFSQYCVSY